MTEVVKYDAATDYSRAPKNERLAYTWELAKAGALLPRTARDRVESFEEQAARVFYLAELGSMMGIHPLEALNGIHLIEGKPSISSALMSSLIRRAGHKLRVTEEGTWEERTFRAVVTIVRHDDPDYPTVMSFGYGDAERAGLLGKDNWRKYGPSMCAARAISKCARAAAEDALGGARYTPEELGAEVDSQGEVIVMEATTETDWAPPAGGPAGEPAAAEPAREPRVKAEPVPDATTSAQPSPQPVDNPPGVQAAAAVPDQAIIENLATVSIQHSKSAWTEHAKGDEAALTEVWNSAKAARILGDPALAFDVLGKPSIWRRDESGVPVQLRVMLRELVEEVRADAAAKVAAEQDAAAEEAQDAPEEHAAAPSAPEEPEATPEATPDDSEVVEGELMDGGDAAGA